jgi:hypothetical protein
MTNIMQNARVLVLVFGLAPLAVASAALTQSLPEAERMRPPATDAPPRTDFDERGRTDDARERPRRDWREDERRFGGRFDRDDAESRGFDRGGRERDDWRNRGERPGGREFDRDARDRPDPSMMGDGSMAMGHGWLMRICGTDGNRLATLMVDRLERLTQPTESQRAPLETLKDAAARASEIARAACPTERPITPPGRLAAAEKRLEALLQAVRTVRPAMEAFYGSLTDEQKARLLIATARPSRSGSWQRRETNPRVDRGYDRRPDDERSERSARGAERWRNEDTDRPRRSWGDRREDGPRQGPRDYDRDSWPDDWRGRM